MDYKTIRYPGHCEQMRLLMNGLKLNQDRGTLKRILENAVPQTLQDVVIIYVAVTGLQDGELREENYVNKVYPQVIAGRLWSAIQVTTAAGLCAVLDLVFRLAARSTAASCGRNSSRCRRCWPTASAATSASSPARTCPCAWSPPARPGHQRVEGTGLTMPDILKELGIAKSNPGVSSAGGWHRTPKAPRFASINPATGKVDRRSRGRDGARLRGADGRDLGSVPAVARRAGPAPGRGRSGASPMRCAGTRTRSAASSAWRPARSRPRATARCRR